MDFYLISIRILGIFIAVKKHNNLGNSYKEKKLIGASFLQHTSSSKATPTAIMPFSLSLLQPYSFKPPQLGLLLKNTKKFEEHE